LKEIGEIQARQGSWKGLERLAREPDEICLGEAREKGGNHRLRIAQTPAVQAIERSANWTWRTDPR